MSPKTYKVIGKPFSTFTRTITLGLNYKNIPFDQIVTSPQSDIAKDAHPYGYLPTLIIEDPSGKVIKLSETQAILRYLDRIKPEPSLHFQPSSDEDLLEEKMWEVASLAASFGFPIVEVGVVKPHLKALEEGIAESEIIRKNTDAVSEITEFLGIIEQRMVPTARFLFAEHPTWADFYLFPPLSDLRALPEWEQAVSGRERIIRWMEAMDTVDAVQKTLGGTLEGSVS